MVELISKISKGSKMDQVYIPKNRVDLAIGSYVIIRPLETTLKEEIKPFFYNIKYIEPIKLVMIKEIFNIIEEIVKSDNIIITGSFLEKGFKFNDIDIIIVSEKKSNAKYIEDILENKIGAKSHIISIDNKTMIKGLSTDPLYRVMLSKCISKKRMIYNIKPEINYKLLDLHLLKSKILIDNFDMLDGDEKYYFIRNMIAIFLFLKLKKIDKEKIDKEIKKIFKLKDVDEIKRNVLNRREFLKKYRQIYNKTFNLLMSNIK